MGAADDAPETRCRVAPAAASLAPPPLDGVAAASA
jgi:hypothetical protein